MKDKTLNGSKKTKPEELINSLVEKYKAEIEYITDKDFLLKLSQPYNLDLSQLYFGVGDEFGFIKNSVNPRLITFIQSSEYIELPFIDSNKDELDNIANRIFSESSKLFLLLGHPGSGKSVFMHKLLQTFGGLQETDAAKMIEVLTKNEAVPTLINLKNCAIDSLDNILRGRKNDCNVNGQQLKFIYLFDGLDELDEKRADNVLSEMYRLSQQSDTKKIIISCRSGNLNRLKAKAYFRDIVEYRIADLEETYIDQFFQRKESQGKIEKLNNLKECNQLIINEIKDIFLINLLWDTISELDATSTIIELFSQKINLLLDDPHHKKNIDSLDILNPKKQTIIELNQDISFKFQKKFQFRFSENKLQHLILKKFERLDYQGVNNIINYIADLFFERSYSENSYLQENYIYQHRRYQEYFFTQRLKTKYEKHPRILRKMKIISNREYFEDLFLNYLKQEYKRENNLVGLVELNLIDIYLGRGKAYGVETAYYTNSNEFIPALACQELSVFNELIEDENLQIKNKISTDFNALNKNFEIWKTDKSNYRARDYLKDIWQKGVSSLINNIAQFWKAEKYDIAKEFIIELKKTTEIYEANKFIKSLDKNTRIEDPVWNELENWIYYKIIVKNEAITDFFNHIIRKRYKYYSDERLSSFDESGKEKLINSFLRVCLKERKDELFEIANTFDNFEFTSLLSVLKTIEYLPIFIQSTLIHEKIKSFVENFSCELNEKNFFILFYKKFFNLSFSNDELEFLKTDFLKLKDKRSMDWKMYNTHLDFSLLCYISNDYSFEYLLRKQESYQYRYYSESRLYAALFKDYVRLLSKEKTIEAIVRDYIRYINFYTEGKYLQQYLKYDISSLLATIFAVSNKETSSLLNLKIILIKEENDVIPFSFYFNLNKLNAKLFSQIVYKEELKQFEDDALSWNDDFYQYIDYCFDLSMMFSSIDSVKSMFYFQ